MGSFADRHGKHDAGVTRREALALAAFGLAATPGPAFAAGLEGQLTWGIHVSLAPTWFDPAETPGIITPFMVLYALHDGMVKPMPGQPLAPSLAESWSGSEDGLAYDFLVRKDAKFHRGMALWPVGKRAIEKTRRRIVTLYTAHR
jgi:peptide/nickel transport system substrate-binding protein